MLKPQKLFEACLFTSVGFTVAHGCLSFILILARKMYFEIAYHNSDYVTWWILFFGLPLIIGIGAGIWLRQKEISLGLRVLFAFVLPLQIAFTWIAATMNAEQWGYAMKRPAVFRELTESTSLLGCASGFRYDSIGMSSPASTRPVVSDLKKWSEQDPYYAGVSRISDVFRTDCIQIPAVDLSHVYQNIQRSGVLDRKAPSYGYEEANPLRWAGAKFRGVDDQIYIVIGLEGGQESNDHYPYNEFLLRLEGGSYVLTRHQKYYVDIAGIEGFEYSNVAPLFSSAVTVIGSFFAMLIMWYDRYIKVDKVILYKQ